MLHLISFFKLTEIENKRYRSELCQHVMFNHNFIYRNIY